MERRNSFNSASSSESSATTDEIELTVIQNKEWKRSAETWAEEFSNNRLLSSTPKKSLVHKESKPGSEVEIELARASPSPGRRNCMTINSSNPISLNRPHPTSFKPKLRTPATKFLEKTLANEEMSKDIFLDTLTTRGLLSLVPPGPPTSFELSITLERIFMNSSVPIKHMFSLDFCPVGSANAPVKCTTKHNPEPPRGKVTFLPIKTVGNWTIPVIAPRNRVLETTKQISVTIEVRYLKDKQKTLPPYAYAVINPSNFLTVMDKPLELSGAGSAELIKVKNNRPFGSIEFVVKLERTDESTLNHEPTPCKSTKSVQISPSGNNSGGAGNAQDLVQQLECLAIQNQAEGLNNELEDVCVDDEIGRLVNQRLSLLMSQSYSQSDAVINLIDKRLEALAAVLRSRYTTN